MVKYEVVFLIEQYGNLIVRNIIKFNKQPTKLLKYQKSQYILSLDKPTYSDKKKVMYFIMFDKGSQLNFKETNPSIDPKTLDLIVGQKIIKELTSGVMDNKKDKIMLIITGFIIGALVSAVGFMMYFNSKISEIYSTLLKDSTIPIIPF